MPLATDRDPSRVKRKNLAPPPGHQSGTCFSPVPEFPSHRGETSAAHFPRLISESIDRFRKQAKKPSFMP